MTMTKKLAKIKNASLNIKDRGILGFWIAVDYEDGFSQMVGGVALDDWCEAKKSRVGTAYGCELIRLLLIEFGVNDFSEMQGMHAWVWGEGGGLQFKAKGIQALRCNNPKTEAVIFSEVTL